MSLGNYREGGGGRTKGSADDWLGPGWHRVRVDSYRPIQAKSGGQGVEFMTTDGAGKKAKATFWVVSGKGSRNCQKVLASFAIACDLTAEELDAYDPENASCHAVLVGREVQVCVVPDGEKYHKVDDWDPVGETVSDQPTPVNPRIDRTQMDEPPPTGSSIPF